MAINPMNEIIQHLRHTVLREGPELSDAELLDRFIDQRDAAALEILVQRHGPMVWGVCHRVLYNHHDAEDAFQASFLVLVRKASSIRPRQMLANWLFGVAHQTAMKARATAAKRKKREKQMVDMPEPVNETPVLWNDLQPLLDREIRHLPVNYRIAIVVCDLEGKTRAEAARQLGLPEGTVASRLTRARSMLAKRLARRGLSVSISSLGIILSEKVASACVPTSLMSATIKVAALLATGRPLVAGVVPVHVITLMRGVLRAMLLSKLITAAAVVLVGIVLWGGGRLAYLGATGQQQKAEPDAAPLVIVKGDEPAARKKEEVSKANKVEHLLKERLATMKEIAAQIEDEFNKTGRIPPEDVVQAKLAVLKAELDLCQSAKEEVSVHEKIVGLSKELEAYAEARFKAGKAQSVDVLKAKANRLEAEVALERAKGKAATGPR